MAIDVKDLTSKMTTAALAVFAKRAPLVAQLVGNEMEKIARNIEKIERLLAEGKISGPQAAIQLEMQKTATAAVLLEAEGLGDLAVEAAINAALAVAAAPVNAALHYKLL